MVGGRGSHPEVIGVYGGSFDPPHMAHVLLPTVLLAQGQVDRLIVAPAADHPLKPVGSPFARRLRWTRAAMAVHGARVTVTDLEQRLSERHGPPSYSIRLLETIATQHPTARVRLVIGSDIVATAQQRRWHRWEAIERRFGPIVVPRVGYAGGGPSLLPEISSSQVRAALARRAWDELEPLVPRAVLELLRTETEDARGDPIALVGQGHVAAHVAPWLRARGFAVRLLGARALLTDDEPQPLAARGVWTLVRDPMLAQVAERLLAILPPGVPVLSAAGGVPAGDARGLAILRAAGHPVGTLHPICSLRREHLGDALERAWFGVGGDPEAVAWARSWVGAQPTIALDHLDASGRAAYHAACALVANHLGVLLGDAESVFADLGIARTEAHSALAHLMRSALDNVAALGSVAGVTGPAARGDVEAVRRHIAALPSPARELYEHLSARLLAARGKEPRSG